MYWNYCSRCGIWHLGVVYDDEPIRNLKMKNRPGLEDGPPRRTRNFAADHVSSPTLDAVTNHTDGTCSFKLDTIPEKGVRTIDVYQGERRLFSLSVGQQGVCYQILQQGHDTGCFTLWEDET